MKIKELIHFLKDFSEDTEVIITDGYNCNCYSGKFQLQEWKDYDGKIKVDIGVGGCLDFDD
jgi:hypothetical protein